MFPAACLEETAVWPLLLPWYHPRKEEVWPPGLEHPVWVQRDRSPHQRQTATDVLEWLWCKFLSQVGLLHTDLYRKRKIHYQKILSLKMISKMDDKILKGFKDLSFYPAIAIYFLINVLGCYIFPRGVWGGLSEVRKIKNR